MDRTELVYFLLVEDNDDHAEMVKRTLEQNRLVNHVDRVADGVEALAYVRREGKYAEKPRPDAILLDLKLPKLDGHEVLAQLKDDESLRTIPVVVLTTSDAEADRLKAYGCHANSYLVKPVDFAKFRRMVDDLSFYWGVWNRPAGEGGVLLSPPEEPK